MHKAKQELKTRTKVFLLVGFLLLAAAIGFVGFYQIDRTTSSGSEESVVQKPQVIQIQKQSYVSTLPLSKATHKESRNQYIVQPGDTYWNIASKLKPSNVEMNPYITVLKSVNKNSALHTTVPINVPNDNDLIHVTLPDVEIHFNVYDTEIIDYIKKAEGSKEAQANNKRRLLGGHVGPSYKNSKFYPYKDIKGNYTIGYGHYLGKRDSDALKYRNGLTNKQAHDLLLQDMQRVYNDYVLLLKRKNAVNLNTDQQRILFEMTFTMGVDKLSNFNQLWRSVQRDNPKKFKKEIQNSLWFRQVGDRAELLLSSL